MRLRIQKSRKVVADLRLRTKLLNVQLQTCGCGLRKLKFGCGFADCGLKKNLRCPALPDTIVSDNDVQFVSREFENFCVKLNIKHLTSPIFHPASNGEAERFVQTFKRSLNKNVEGGKSLIDSVRFVLATYRSSLHPSLDWRTPAELLHGRQTKSLVSLFLPGTSTMCQGVEPNLNPNRKPE